MAEFFRSQSRGGYVPSEDVAAQRLLDDMKYGPVQVHQGTPADPFGFAERLASAGSKALGGPDLTPAFDVATLLGGGKGAQKRAPKILKRLTKSVQPMITKGIKRFGSSDLGKSIDLANPFGGGPDYESPASKPVSPEQETLLRGLNRRAKEPKNIATKFNQPMMY
jgi:hypothetical protein